MMEVQVFPSKKGEMSGRVTYFDPLLQVEKSIILCSKFNPLEEARRWAKQTYEAVKESYVIYGLGLGYHIQALEELLSEGKSIYVIETNLTLHNQIKQHIPQQIYTSAQVKLILTEDIRQISEVLQTIQSQQSKICIYEPLLKLMPPSCEKLKQVLETYQFRNNSITAGRHREYVQQNYQYYKGKEYPNISQWYQSQQNKPLIIVSAGPSLEKNIQVLKEIDDKVFVFTVGRVLKKLLAEGIKPDMFGMIDPHHELMISQVEGVENQDIPMAFLNTASYQAVEKYPGPKYMAYSMDFDEKQEGRIETGGSVATALLDLAIRFGANPILFIGQDLAFTNNHSHIKGTDHTWEISQTQGMVKVKDREGAYLPTNRAMLTFKYFIEDKIRQNPQIDFYNCTEGGAYIEGCKHQGLYETIRQFNCAKN